MYVRSSGIAPGRNRNPSRPAEAQSSRSAASCDGVPVNTVASLVYTYPARSSIRAFRSAASSTDEPRNTTRSAKTRTEGAPIEETSEAACAAEDGVTNPTSADDAINANGSARCPSTPTTGCPCGGRGVIDGPFTLKRGPVKSM
jgi:hypothetical protein